jgi:hypothetical protein
VTNGADVYVRFVTLECLLCHSAVELGLRLWFEMVIQIEKSPG